MASHTYNFEWHVGEEQWGRLLATDNLARATKLSVFPHGESRLVMAALRSMLTIALAIIVGSASSLSVREFEHDQLELALQRTLAVEEMAWKRNDRLLFESLVDKDVFDLWIIEWRKYWRGNAVDRHQFSHEIVHVEPIGQQIFVDMIDSQPARDWWQTSPLRETRIYSYHDGQWIRSVPPEGYWGKRLSLETRHIHYGYSERDQALVATVAPEVDHAYEKLLKLLALDPIDQRRKIGVHLAPNPRRGRAARSTQIYVTSPLLATMPARLSDSEYIQRFILEQLVALSVNRATDWVGNSQILHWSTIMWAIRGQLTDRLIGMPSPWFAQNEPVFEEYGRQRFPIQLDQLTAISNRRETPDKRHMYWQQISAELLISYMLDTFGEDRLIALVDGFGEHRSWDTLIPAVFGVSQNEFEEEWNRYLGTRYDWLP